MTEASGGAAGVVFLKFVYPHAVNTMEDTERAVCTSRCSAFTLPCSLRHWNYTNTSKVVLLLGQSDFLHIRVDVEI